MILPFKQRQVSEPKSIIDIGFTEQVSIISSVQTIYIPLQCKRFFTVDTLSPMREHGNEERYSHAIFS